MHHITEEILDLVSWFEEHGYTRDKVLEAFDDVIWFIDHNSKIQTKNNCNIVGTISHALKRKGISPLASIGDTV